MTSYKPMILSSQLWLSLLALCFYASEVSAKVHTHYHATTSNKICFDKNHKVIPCPKSKKNLIIGLIIAGSLIGVFVLGGILYCCCCAGEVACATCAACCCLCCGKRKKTSGGQVYQTLPEQGNNATIPQSTYTPNTMSYNYTTSSSDAPYDPPRPGATAFSGPSPYEKYDTNTAVSHAAQGHGEAASYYNNSYNSLPELKYDYRGGEGASSKVSLPQVEVPAYQPPSYPPTNSH